MRALKTVQIRVVITPAMADAVDKIAVSTELYRSDIVRMALANFLRVVESPASQDKEVELQNK